MDRKWTVDGDCKKKNNRNLYILFSPRNDMPLYTEGVLWYFLALDCLMYNLFAWTRSQKKHWLSSSIPFHPILGAGYLCLILWLGFALQRMQLLGF